MKHYTLKMKEELVDCIGCIHIEKDKNNCHGLAFIDYYHQKCKIITGEHYVLLLDKMKPTNATIAI